MNMLLFGILVVLASLSTGYSVRLFGLFLIAVHAPDLAQSKVVEMFDILRYIMFYVIIASSLWAWAFYVAVS